MCEHMLFVHMIKNFLKLFSEEEISAMRKELEKYGINMPAFSKIGGILATEVSSSGILCDVGPSIGQMMG